MTTDGFPVIALLIVVAIVWAVIGFGFAWMVFETIPRMRNDGMRVRWSLPPREWFARPKTVGKGTRDAFALLEHRSLFGLRRRLIYLPPLHTLVLGPSGSGKSISLMSALLTWNGGAFVLDPKGEFWETTSGWRATVLGHLVWKWDVRAGQSDDASGIPIDALYGGRENAIDRLAQIIVGEDTKQAPFVYPWIAIIRAFLADAELQKKPPWQTAFSIPSSAWQANLERIARTDQHPGARFAQEALGKAPAQEYFASIAGTADQVAPVFRAIGPLLDRGIGIPVPELEKSTIYLVLPTSPLQGELIALRWIFGGLDAFVNRREPIKKPGALWIIDEAGALRPEGLANWVRFMRGKGVSVIIATQNLSDLSAGYGNDNANSIIGAMNGPHIFIGWRQMSEPTVALLAQPLTSSLRVRRRTPGSGQEDVPGTLEDARRFIARMKHGVMFPQTGHDRPCAVYPAAYFRWFPDRVLSPVVSPSSSPVPLAAPEGASPTPTPKPASVSTPTEPPPTGEPAIPFLDQGTFTHEPLPFLDMFTPIPDPREPLSYDRKPKTAAARPPTPQTVDQDGGLPANRLPWFSPQGTRAVQAVADDQMRRLFAGSSPLQETPDPLRPLLPFADWMLYGARGDAA